MLSYRHAFHAGNHADLIKHLTLVLTLDYFLRKDKPFWYIDTHAGAGAYTLASTEAQKNREFSSGIQPLWEMGTALPEAFQPYLELIRQANPAGKLKQYPGSPWLAARMLRSTDQLRLFELHPTDHQALNNLLAQNQRIQISQQDGLKGLLSLLPPPPRRAVTLIDPSYEIKSDYDTVVETLIKAHKRFATGTYLLWYPVVSRQRVKQIFATLQASRIPDILQIEFCPLADGKNQGMTGSGMFVINPPWLLAQQMQTILPWLTLHTGNPDSAHFTLQQVNPEKN